MTACVFWPAKGPRCAALDQMWPALQSRRDGDKLAPAAEALRTALDAETFYARLPEIARLAGEIATAYCQDYTALHDERAERFGAAIEEIKGRVEWTEVPEGMRDIVLASLKDRQCRPPTVETAETP